jgi:hypothetical protein
MHAAWIRLRQGVSRDRLRVRRAFNSRQLKRILAGVIAGLVVLVIVRAVIEDVEAAQAPMHENTLYYALSTIAQCAAALAAILGAFGLWRLGHLREFNREDEEQERQIKLKLVRVRVQREYEQEKEAMGTVATEGEQSSTSMAALTERRLELRLTYIDARRQFVLAEWRWLTKMLVTFLLGTLAILVFAIVGLAFVDTLCALVRTVRTFVILASFGLGIGPAVLVWNAAHRSRPGTILAWAFLALVWVLPAEAASRQPAPPRLPQHCTTYEEKTLGRLQTVCDDSTRAVSTYNRTLGRWESTVTPPPGKTCTGRLNPRTHQWEGRCR